MDKNAYLVDDAATEPLWPTPPPFVSPWTFELLAQRVNAIAVEDCCRGLVQLLLDVTREADQRLAKALFDNWTLQGLLGDKQGGGC